MNNLVAIEDRKVNENRDRSSGSRHRGPRRPVDVDIRRMDASHTQLHRDHVTSSTSVRDLPFEENGREVACVPAHCTRGERFCFQGVVNDLEHIIPYPPGTWKRMPYVKNFVNTKRFDFPPSS